MRNFLSFYEGIIDLFIQYKCFQKNVSILFIHFKILSKKVLLDSKILFELFFGELEI